MVHSLKDVAETLEAINGRALDENEQYAIGNWQKGRALAHTINSPGWDVVLELLASYATKETQRLLTTDPANKEEVLAAHAIAFAASRINTLFIEDVQALIGFSSQTPEIVKHGLLTPVPPESIAT